MPIYEYACTDCGHQGEHMQKLADAPLTVCPSCGKSTYSKKISAAGFALKGSGWYVTDFRNGNKAPAKSGDKPDSGESSKTSSDSAVAQTTGASDTKAASPAPAPAPAASPAPASAPVAAG
jgi:putative FmdB family regulatory protein